MALSPIYHTVINRAEQPLHLSDAQACWPSISSSSVSLPSKCLSIEAVKPSVSALSLLLSLLRWLHMCKRSFSLWGCLYGTLLIGLCSRVWSINEHLPQPWFVFVHPSPVALGIRSAWPELNGLYLYYFLSPHFILCWMEIKKLVEVSNLDSKELLQQSTHKWFQQLSRQNVKIWNNSRKMGHDKLNKVVG